jgi:sensor c-di-GMP phosphodiesterase-like protein
MGTTLSIIAIAGLSLLLIISTQRWRAEQAAKKQALAHAHTGVEEQRDRSERLRAGARAAHAERIRTEASDTDAQRVGAEADQ